VTRSTSISGLGHGLELELDTASGRGSPGARRLIVLATSGSRASVEATVFAAELAGALAATLRIVHVVPPIEYRVGRLAPMRSIPRRVSDPFDPPEAIIAAATDAQADLLVIGARGSWRFRAAPTQRWVQAHAPCQVLTASVARCGRCD
jgi:nucleotide-binding universal stress UspA family protein